MRETVTLEDGSRADVVVGDWTLWTRDGYRVVRAAYLTDGQHDQLLTDTDAPPMTDEALLEAGLAEAVRALGTRRSRPWRGARGE